MRTPKPAPICSKTRMRSLRDIGYADWFTLIEPLVDL